MNITLEQARSAFAQWWKDYTTDPKAFKKGPDLEGKDSAQCFFEYAKMFRGDGKHAK